MSALSRIPAAAEPGNAPSPEAAAQALAGHARDLLHALDHGYFGDGHRFSDGTESAFVVSLREGLAAFDAASRPVAQRAAPLVSSARSAA